MNPLSLGSFLLILFLVEHRIFYSRASSVHSNNQRGLVEVEPFRKLGSTSNSEPTVEPNSTEDASTPSATTAPTAASSSETIATEPTSSSSQTASSALIDSSSTPTTTPTS